MKFRNTYSGDDLDLLVRYVTGECEKKEVAAIQARIAVDEQMAQLLDELQAVWSKFEPPAREIDIDSARSRFFYRVRHEASIRPLHGGRLALRSHHESGRTRRSTGLRFSVLLAVIIGISALVVQLHAPGALELSTVSSREIITGKGQRATITLVDGSEVRLNVEGRLEIPSDFGAEHREVYLEGQAFFDVGQDTHRPFIVHTLKAVVSVLGTEFDVRAYPELDEVNITVLTGEVAVETPGITASDTLVLSPGQRGTVLNGKLSLLNRADLAHYLAWTEGRLVFRDTPFEEVMRLIERWYDLEVQLIGVPTGLDGLTAVFKDEPLSEVVSSIAAVLNLRYERENGRITFYRN